VLVEGTPSGVAERARRLAALLASGEEAGQVEVAGAAPPRWGQLPSGVVVVRVSFWVSALAAVLQALSAAAAEAGLPRPVITGPAGAGALYACLDPGTGEQAAARFAAALRERLPDPGRSSAVVLAAPPAVLAAGALGTVPGLALMRAVKDQFDPDHRMFPGRLLEGA
jgi:glycolate oxidase FAD binding subunit